MTRLGIVILIPSILLLGGCTFLDAITGVKHNDDGSITIKPGGGAAGATSSLAGGLPGWLGLGGTLLGLATTVYGRIRGKQYSQALGAVVAGVDTALAGGVNTTVTKEALYAAITKMIAEQVDDPSKVKAIIAGVKDAFRNG